MSKEAERESVLKFWGRTCRAAIAAQPQARYGTPHFTVQGILGAYGFDRGDAAGPGLVLIGASTITVVRGDVPQA